MLLRKIRIESFGGIADREFTLGEGFRTICEKNGWGKSTLAVFLKVMFYGFSGETAKTLAAREREQYRPWNTTGAYGGSIEFEYEGKEYELRRVFAKKAADDTLTVTDLKTNLPVEEFGSIPGEKIYGIDADSFFNTIYIADGECVSRSTDGINERIGNPGGVPDDAGAVGDVLKRLKDKTNQLTGGRATGAIAKIENRISGLNAELLNAPVLTERCEKENRDREALRAEIGEKTQLLARRRKAYAAAGARKANDIEKKRYDDLKERVTAAEALLQEEAAFFGGKTPDTGILAETEARLTEIEKHTTIHEDHELTDTEREELLALSTRYPAAIDEETLSSAEACAATLKEMRAGQSELKMSKDRRARLEELQRRYESETAGTDLVAMGDLYQTLSELRSGHAQKELQWAQIIAKEQNRLDREEVLMQNWEREQERADRVFEASIDRLERRRDDRKKRVGICGKLLLCASVLLLLAGVVSVVAALSGHGKLLTAFLLLAAGAVSFGIRFLLGSADKKADEEEETERERLQEESIIPKPEGIGEEGYLPEEKRENQRMVKETEAEISDMSRKLKSTENELRALLFKYGSSPREGMEEAEIGRLETEMKEYKKLRFEGLEYDKKGYESGIRETEEKLRSLLPGADLPEGEEKQALLRIRQELARLEDLRSRDHRTKEAADTLRGLKEKNDEILGEYRSLHPEYGDDAALINALQERLTTWRNRSEELERAKAALAEYENEHGGNPSADTDTGEAEAEAEETAGSDATSAETEEENGASPEEIAKEIGALEEELEQRKEDLRKLTEHMSESEAELDHLDEVREELEELTEKKQLYTLQHDIYSKTAKYLKQAKEEYLSSFVRPLGEAFASHYAEISDTREDYRIDVDLKLSCEKEGAYRTIERMSSGYRDLAYLCLRLALVDIMYEKETPLLIMDDPFVHMDAEKTKRALSYLEKKKDRYQILYLTCHKEAV